MIRAGRQILLRKGKSSHVNSCILLSSSWEKEIERYLLFLFFAFQGSDLSWRGSYLWEEAWWTDYQLIELGVPEIYRNPETQGIQDGWCQVSCFLSFLVTSEILMLFEWTFWPTSIVWMFWFIIDYIDQILNSWWEKEQNEGTCQKRNQGDSLGSFWPKERLRMRHVCTL